MRIRSLASYGTALGLTLLLAGFVEAAQQGGGIQKRNQQRLRDGSCLTQPQQLQQRDRLRDGSCRTMSPATLTADQLRTRDQDRLKDGSCKTTP
jgi:hypothetical protein